MTSDYFSPDNVLVVTIGEDPENDQNAYQALSDLSSSIRRARSRSPLVLSSCATTTATST